MIGRLWAIAYNTYREAVRDRVLYNLILFALLIVGASVLFGQISLEINRIVLINLGLTAISLFGIVIAIFIGIGLVSKEIEKKTLYTVLAARPVRRWEFITGKFLGLVMTLTVNALLMSVGFFAAVLYVSHRLGRGDLQLVTAIYFILLEFVLITALALLFSTFSTPVFSSIFAFAIFAIGTFGEDLRGICTDGQRGDPMGDDRGGVPGAQLCGAQRHQPGGPRHGGGTETDPAEHSLRAGLHGGGADRLGLDLRAA